MKRRAAILLTVVLLSVTGCAGPSPAQEETASSQTNSVSQQILSSAQSETSHVWEESEMKLQLTMGEAVFTVQLYDNPASRAFWEQLPLTLSMNELNGNEKYHYLPQSFPTQPQVPEQIHAGDLMLFGSDCLVLFYQTFSTSYSYTPLGRVENISGLAEAVGSGSVTVQFTPAP